MIEKKKKWKLADFDYSLPEKYIAQYPTEKRDKSKLMVIHKESGEIEHKLFSDLPDYLKKNEKEIFETLVKVPLKFRDKDYTQESHRSFYGRAVTLTKDGDYNDIRFSVATMDALDCHPDIMEKVYKAHHRFGNLLHDDKFQIKFRLEPGDIFSFNNRRILHGRTAFDPNSGHRHLQGYYMDRDEILGRLNFLKKKI